MSGDLTCTTFKTKPTKGKERKLPIVSSKSNVDEEKVRKAKEIIEWNKGNRIRKMAGTNGK